jgi:hypothetical protein
MRDTSWLIAVLYVGVVAAGCGARSGLGVDTNAGGSADAGGAAAREGESGRAGAPGSGGVYCAAHAGPVASCDAAAAPVQKCSAAFPFCVNMANEWACCVGDGPPYNGPGGSCVFPGTYCQ